MGVIFSYDYPNSLFPTNEYEYSIYICYSVCKIVLCSIEWLLRNRNFPRRAFPAGLFPDGIFPAGLFAARIFHARAFSRVNYCVNYDKKKCLFNANLIDGVRRATDSY